MKRILLLFITSAIATFCFGTRRALVIGISSYPQDVSNYWQPTNGANDVTIIREMLLANGFGQDDVSTLTDSQATCKRIKQSLNTLLASAGKGDIIYIHFSGHGQQVTDLDGDEPDGMDEAWAAYDSRMAYSKEYKGENHITDDYLNVILSKMARKVGKDGKIIVVTDACHSGTATRKEHNDTLQYRGTAAPFLLSGKKPLPYRGQNSIQWIAISACKDNEFNRQCHDYPYGSLSYALYTHRHQLGETIVADLRQKLKETVTALTHRTQTPQVEAAEQLMGTVLL